jgi:molybdopterin-guanine dinucleotide biosynthesis protein A
VPSSIDKVFVTSCDVPLLRPSFVARLLELCSGDVDIVVPKDDQFHHPLSAVYRTRVLGEVRSLLGTDRPRLTFLFSRLRTLEVDAESLRDVDPQLDSLRNLNAPQDYFECLAQAGLAVDERVQALLKSED